MVSANRHCLRTISTAKTAYEVLIFYCIICIIPLKEYKSSKFCCFFLFSCYRRLALAAIAGLYESKRLRTGTAARVAGPMLVYFREIDK
jgi:hypothetical protein